MSGLTWNALHTASKDDPELAKRAQHYLYRTTLEFYDYEKDPDALNNLIDDSSHQEIIQTHLEKLLQLMEETGDHELPNFIKTFNITKE